MPRKPTNRPAKTAKRQKRREKKEWKSPSPKKAIPKKKPAPWPSRKKNRPSAAKSPKFKHLKKKLATAALFGAVCMGASGCTQLGIKSVDLEARHAADKAARKTASRALETFVPFVGGKVGNKLGGMAVEIVLGPDMLKEIEKIPKDKRFKYANGLPVANQPWFKILGLRPSAPEHKPMIDAVEMLSIRTKVMPEEIVLVLGANPKSMWEDKVFAMRKMIPETGRQINLLEEDIAKIKPKFGKKEDILKKLKSLYRSKDRMALEFMVIKSVMNMGNDPRINSLIKVISQKMPIKGCQSALDVLY